MSEQKSENWIEFRANGRIALQELESHIESLAMASTFSLDHDPDWIRANTIADDGVKIYYAGTPTLPLGYAPFYVAQAKLPVHLGELSIWSFRVSELRLIGGPILSDDSSSSSITNFITLLCKIRPNLGLRDVIFLGRLDTTWYPALQKSSLIGHSFFLLPWGNTQIQRVIKLPDSYEAYIAELGKKTRADLRRHVRTLDKVTEAQVEVKVYSSPEDVAGFLDDATRVSQQTYQWHLLKRGLRNSSAMAQKLKTSSAKGWMLCYVLFCKSEPVAFMIGYSYRGRYWSTDIGYDPLWGKFSVGNVLHCAVIADLIENRPDVSTFDFVGDNSNKRRLSNAIDGEMMDLYLIPRSAYGLFIYGSLVASITLSAWAGSILDRLGIKERLRKMLRRWSTG